MNFKEKLEKVHSIPIKEIISAFGGEFVNDKNFKHTGLFGHEETPASFIYMKNGVEHFKNFKTGQNGDCLDFVSLVTGETDKVKVLDIIMGKEKNYSIIDATERKKLQIKQDREKLESDRRKMFAIIKNSVPLEKSNLGVEYFLKRGIEQAALNLQDQNIEIRVNSFISKKEGKRINNICFLFNGSKKLNTHRFMIIKGINENAEKNGVKLNLMQCRPIIHQSEIRKPFAVVEGIEDGLSAIELGYKNFISLNSTSNVNKFIITIKNCFKWFKTNSLEICLDNDKAGHEAIKKIKVFTNLETMYEEKTIDTFKKDLIGHPQTEYVLKILNNYKNLQEMNDSELITVVNHISILFRDDYFKNYGTAFIINESKYYRIMNELGNNDLNEMLMNVYKAPFEEVLNNINSIEKEYKETAR